MEERNLVVELSEPFAEDQVHQRKGNFGKTLRYVSVGDVINRLNDVLGMDWSFRVVQKEETNGWVSVLCEMTVNGIVKQQYGGKDLTIAKNSGKVLQPVDDTKAAVSDGLKKCASLFGVALDLYEDTEPGERQQTGYQGSNRPHGVGSDTAQDPEPKSKKSNIGDYKNRIYELEKELSGTYDIETMRKTHLKETNLGTNDIEKLEKYGKALKALKEKKNE